MRNTLVDLVFITHYLVGERPAAFVGECRLVNLAAAREVSHGRGDPCRARFQMDRSTQRPFSKDTFRAEMQQRCSVHLGQHILALMIIRCHGPGVSRGRGLAV